MNLFQKLHQKVLFYFAFSEKTEKFKWSLSLRMPQHNVILPLNFVC